MCVFYGSPPEFIQNKKGSKWKIPPQTPPFPFATSEFKNKSAEVLANPFPKKLLCQNFVRIEAPPHCPNTWRAEPQKEKCPFHFRKNHPRENQKKQGTFFLFGFAE